MKYAGKISEAAYVRLMTGIFVVALVFNFVPLYLDWNQPLSGMHGFRQTQTAITVQSMARGGPLLGYETPVVGAPWRIPFEFPLYQWCVLVAYRVAPLSLDQAGRLVSWAAFLLTLWPLWVIVKRLGGDGSLYLLTGSMLLCSPTYAYWSKAFMIESTAVCASMSFVALVLVYLVRPRAWVIAAAMVAAGLAACVKVTTYSAFVAAAGLLVLRDFHSRFRQEGPRRLAVRYAPLGAVIATSIVLLAAWVNYSDGLKRESIIGGSLTSSALKTWNFGDWGQLLSLQFREVLTTRIVPDTLGVHGPIRVGCLLFVAGLIACRPNARTVAVTSGLLGLFLLPMAVYTNLYLIHNYYQYANAIFLIGAVAVPVWRYRKVAPGVVAVAAVLLLLACEVTTSVQLFRAACLQDKRTAHEYQVARLIKESTPENSLIIGVGFDWSSVVPYYAERRAVLVPPWVVERIARNFDSAATLATGGMPVAAIVDQPYSELAGKPYQKLLVDKVKQRFGAGMRVERVGACEVLLRR